MSILQNRHEILFLYDIQNANPNGDPNDENKPRMDEETGKNLVTDVRLKRTVRDYLQKQGNDIFVREVVYNEEGHIQDGKLRALDYLPEKNKLEELEKQRQAISNAVLEKCIDVRLFGATIPLELKVPNKKTKKTDSKTSSITYTGPVQFKMGKSLHSVKIQHVKGTGAFASKQGSSQKTFREEYFVHYSLIAFHGIANENGAVYTKMTEGDFDHLKKVLWNGTKELISRSKFGQMPRLLIDVEYKEKGFFIGDLDHLLVLKSSLLDEQIRKPEDYTIDISKLLEKFTTCKEKINSITFLVDSRIKFTKGESKISLEDIKKENSNISFEVC